MVRIFELVFIAFSALPSSLRIVGAADVCSQSLDETSLLQVKQEVALGSKRDQDPADLSPVKAMPTGSAAVDLTSVQDASNQRVAADTNSSTGDHDKYPPFRDRYRYRDRYRGRNRNRGRYRDHYDDDGRDRNARYNRYRERPRAHYRYYNHRDPIQQVQPVTQIQPVQPVPQFVPPDPRLTACYQSYCIKEGTGFFGAPKPRKLMLCKLWCQKKLQRQTMMQGGDSYGMQPGGVGMQPGMQPGGVGMQPGMQPGGVGYAI